MAVPAASSQQGGSGTGGPRPPAYPSGVTKAVTAFIDATRFDAIPEKAIVEAKRCLIDGFGVVLAGATVHGSAIVRDHIKSSLTTPSGGGARAL